MRIRSVFILFLLICVWIIISLNSYGSHDVQLWVYWAKEFSRTGFWENFFSLSDIPLLATLFIHFSGLVTKSTYGVVNEITFPGILKILQIPFLLLSVYFSNSLIKKNNKYYSKDLIKFMILINPAIILNLAILGYVDILFVTTLLGCIYFINKMESDIKMVNLWSILFCALLVIGLFVKPQFIMFFPILVLFGGYLILKKNLVKFGITGVLLGVFIIFSTMMPSANSFGEIVQRFTWTKNIFFERIMKQGFVVANFPNLWQFINFIVHTCQSDCPVGTANNILDFLFKPIYYWGDQNLAIKGKIVFYVAVIVYGYLIIRNIVNERSLNIRNSITTITVLTSLWMNTIYSFFSTVVHENHLIAAVYLSVALYALAPSSRNFKIYIFFTIINYVNMFYFYGFGISGLFGIFASGNPSLLEQRLFFSPFELNLSLILTLIYGLALFHTTLRLIRGQWS